jgi:hydroxymethylpyrimidine pyrophosphatase-like HAD family hydrolase
VTSKDATKLNALSRLCAQLNVAPEHVIAIGDSRNDVPMMQWAGIGVAMGNALPEVREAVAYVTDRNTDDGVAHALERYVLGPIARREKSA